LFCLGPLFIVVRAGLSEGGIIGIAGSALSERNGKIILFTFIQALISSLMTILFALPGAYLLAKYRFPGRHVMLSLTTIPFVIPSLVLAVGFLTLFGAHGYINSALVHVSGRESTLSILYTPYVIIMAHVFLNFPVGLRILHSRFRTMDGSLVRASYVAGASSMRTFLKVVLPQMRYSLLAAASLVFTFCFLSFGVIMAIGGMTNATTEVEISRNLGGGNDPVGAGSLLIVQTLILMISAGIYVYSSREDEAGSGILRGNGIGDGRRVGILKGVWTALYIIVAALIIMGPLVSVGISSLHPGARPGGEITLDNFRSVISKEGDAIIGATPMEAVENSLLFAFIATCITVPISTAAAYLLDSRGFKGRIGLDALILFPIGSSAIALGYGLASGNPGAMISGTWMIIVLVHTLLAYPFCTRAILSAKRELDRSLVRSAALMGASRIRILKDIELPALLPGISVAAAFAFAISLGELGATYMVFSPEYATMPVALYQFINGGRDLGAMAAYSVIMMAITASSVFTVDLATRSLGRFVQWL
jgi:thiamine transport system permease protein